ncbi:MAG: exo-alpha-sialidase [Calditrichaeota bacterium]|nr:MAG: exo-alpha-sialidase [Calditrichota bacterium]
MLKKLAPGKILFIGLFFLLPCRGHSGEQWQIVEVTSPAAVKSGEPNLFSGKDGTAFLSWIEAVDDASGHALRFSVWQGRGWSPPRTVATGKHWFVNWADFPSVVSGKDGWLAAHFLVKNAAAPYAYEVRLTHSLDGGERWSTPITPHTDGTPTEHGFVSLLPVDENRLLVVWLDGRKYALTPGTTDGETPAAGEMSLRGAFVDRQGRLFGEAVLDPRTCDCCQTSAVLTPEGPVVFYRDRSPEEIRDISYVRFVGGKWERPRLLHDDGWQIHGCPVNGPAADAREDKVVVAWFTAAGDTPRVKVAFSSGAGATFASATVVDEGNPLGRVDVVYLPDGSALVCWLERTSSGAEIRVRRIYGNGRMEASFALASTTPARSSGFPRMVSTKTGILIAWTDVASSRVRTAFLKLSPR